MNEVCKVVFGLAGGLALFLYGMNSMSWQERWLQQCCRAVLQLQLW